MNTIVGSINDDLGNPLPYTHVINLQTNSGTTCDSSGIFKIKAGNGNILLFKNLAFIDTSVIITNTKNHLTIYLSKRKYPIPEVKIFEWGSTYEDFKQALLKMPMKENLADKLNLPKQDPHIVPYYLNSDVLSSVGFAFSSPVDFLYLSLNKKEISRRKVYELNKSKKQVDQFNAIYSYETITNITGLNDQELFKFMEYLNEHFQCDYHCSEIQIMNELYKHWNNYKENILKSE